MELVKTWNKVIKCLDEVQKAWFDHRKLYEQTEVRDLGEEPMDVQQMMGYPIHGCKFDVAMERLVDMHLVFGKPIEDFLVEEAKSVGEEAANINLNSNKGNGGKKNDRRK